MALRRSSGRLARPLAFGLVLVIVATFGLAAVPPAAAAFSDLRVDPGAYTGTTLYVPGETMVITVVADPGDTYDIEVYHWIPFGSRSTRATFDDEVVPTSGERTVTWIIPATSEDSVWYWITVYDPNWFELGAGAAYDTYLFEIRGYDFAAWLDSSRYIPGDTITVGWSATLVRDGSPAPAGDGEIQAYNGPTSLLASPYNFTASQGSFSFDLSTAEDPNRDPHVQIWFNDTTGSRLHEATLFFDIGFFDIFLSVGATYAPGAVVTVDVWSKAAPTAGGAGPANPGVTDAVINITILDVGTGATTSYGATGLTPAYDGRVSHVFRLATTPTSGVYDVQIQGTAHGVFTATDSDTFDVQSTSPFLVQLVLDRREYVSGETATATASSEPAGANDTYVWRVWNTASGATLFQASTGGAILSFPIPSDYTGSLSFTVTVDDGQGNSDTVTNTVGVAVGYLAVNIDPYQFTAGDLLTGSFSLRSVVMTNPTYFYEFRDADGNLVASGNQTTVFATYRTPDPASSSYTFRVTASAGGRSVTGTAISGQAAQFFLSLTLDRSTYLPGEAVRVGYALSSRGPVSWPSVFRLSVTLAGSSNAFVTTTSRSGEFALVVPAGSNEGDILLFAFDLSTGAAAYETVHVGATNALWSTDVAGIPVFAVILALLVGLLALVVLVLWRKVATSGLPPRVQVERPAAPPPPAAPKGPTSPMAVACRNCGTTIDITTSKRPIEVMCPSCGETQLVQ
jgi:hypothetical protein